MPARLSPAERLQSKRCPSCRGRKVSGEPFCRFCLSSLPEHKQQQMFRRERGTFLDNYESALEFLRLNT